MIPPWVKFDKCICVLLNSSTSPSSKSKSFVLLSSILNYIVTYSEEWIYFVFSVSLLDDIGLPWQLSTTYMFIGYPDSKNLYYVNSNAVLKIFWSILISYLKKSVRYASRLCRLSAISALIWYINLTEMVRRILPSVSPSISILPSFVTQMDLFS